MNYVKLPSVPKAQTDKKWTKHAYQVKWCYQVNTRLVNNIKTPPYMQAHLIMGQIVGLRRATQ